MAETKHHGFRLSLAQEHLWSFQDDLRTSYRAQIAILIKGILDIAVLEEALQKVVDRHEVLRTSFHRQTGFKIPFQVVADAVKPSLRYLDLTELGSGLHERLEELFEEERSVPVDFDRPTLLSEMLIAVSTDNHVLLITLPSICGDGSTMNNLVREISRSYEAVANGKELPEEPFQYADFAEWQHELLEADDGDAKSGRAYWEKKDGRLSVLPDVFKRGTTDEQRNTGPDLVAIEITPALLSTIESVAQSCEVSLRTYLMACWHCLLWRLIDKPKIVIGSIFDGRKYEELKDALGLYAKVLPINCDFEDGKPFNQILNRVQRDAAEADDWFEYFQYEPRGETLPLTVGFEFDDTCSEYPAGGLTFSIYKHYSWIYPFKLKLSVRRFDNRLTAEFYYDPNSLKAETVERIALNFETLLRSSIVNPATPVGELEILDAAERAQLLFEFNQSSAEFPEDVCVQELFERQVHLTPQAIALVVDGERLTYSELNARANQLAHLLRRCGVGPEVCVGLCMEPSVEMFVGLMGVIKAGGAYVPLNPEHPKSRLSQQLAGVQAPVLISQLNLLGAIPDFSGLVICLDGDPSLLEDESKTNPTRITDPQNLCYVIYTSGSTGASKGVAVSHHSLVNYAHFICTELELKKTLSGGLNFATVSTIAADLGNTSIFPCLISGGCLHLVSNQVATDGSLFAEYISQNGIDLLKIVPSHLDALLSTQQETGVLPRRYLILGGETLSWDLVERISENAGACKLINHYGPTETTVGSLTFSLERDDTSGQLSPTVPIGRPIANSEVYLLDKHLKPVPIGVVGELFIGGAGLARGYFNQPDQTAERFIPNPFSNKASTRLYRTGDLARYLPDGNLEFIGRVDQQLKIRGFRIEPGEIEATLLRHSAVRQSLVTKWEAAPGDVRLVAYVVSARVLAIDELREWLQLELPAYMVPSHFVMLKSLPLTPNGKVDRKSLPPPDQSQTQRETLFLSPRNAVEEAVSKVWIELLKNEQISIHDNFFDLGGHSLLVTQVISRIRRRFHLELPLQSLFENPTVAGLAKLIERAQEEDKAQLLTELEMLSDEEAQRLCAIESQEESSSPVVSRASDVPV